MSEEAGRKRVLIFSGMSASVSNAFYGLLEEANPEIDSSFRPKSLSEADITVYFFNAWSDAPSAPGAKELYNVFDRLDKSDVPLVSQGVWATMSTGREMRFVFYSLSDAKYPPLECYARHLALEAKREPGENFENNHLFDCASEAE
ncbi:hypothetical protein [Pseudovibrio sp. SCP19]|uniref:hypothetical protein n=1 Tax=Pseudovibrio sp. SCP19 TaxID=3141374 RepID=UPI0033379912